MRTVVFNLNGTLTTPGDLLDEEIRVLLIKLLHEYNVGIISGSSWKQVNKQLSGLLNIGETKGILSTDCYIDPQILNRLYILPSSGGSMYQSWGKYGWVATYQNKLSTKDIEIINSAFEYCIDKSGFEQPNKMWGKQLENCDSSIVFSPLGCKAPGEVKAGWDMGLTKRKPLIDSLKERLSNYDITSPGTTIEVSLKGINRKYGIDELIKKLRINKDDIIYIGHGFNSKGSGGYFAVDMGLNYIHSKDPEDTKGWIRNILDVELIKAKVSI
jgi:hypothetical protein